MMVGYAGSRGYDLVSAIEGNPVRAGRSADGSLFFPAGAPRQNPAWAASTTQVRRALHVPRAPDEPD